MKKPIQALLIAFTALLFLNGCSATKTAIEATAITETHKQAQSSDSTHVVSSATSTESEKLNIDTSSKKKSNVSLVTDNGSETTTISAANGTITVGKDGETTIAGTDLKETTTNTHSSKKYHKATSEDDTDLIERVSLSSILKNIDIINKQQSASSTQSSTLNQLKIDHSSTPVFTLIWAIIAPLAVPGLVVVTLLVVIVLVVKKRRKK